MPPSLTSRPWLLVLQFWVSFSRLVIALYESIVMCYQIKTIRNWGSDDFFARPLIDAGSFILLSFQLGLWITLVLNDVYMLAIDFKRTNTYIGCVATQSLVSIAAIIISAISIVTERGWAPIKYIPGPFGGKYQYYGSAFFLFAFPTALGILCSICLLIIAVFPAMSYDQYIPLKQMWKSNTKDFLMGTVGPYTTPALSFTGQPRICRVSANNELHAPGNIITRFFSPVLFRRVSPTETRTYAFVRNSFSLVSICVLIFRAVTALQKAQNQIGTKMTSDSCAWGVISEDHSLALLLAMPNYTALNINPPQVKISKEKTSSTAIGPVRDQETCYPTSPGNCSHTDMKYVYPYYQVFSCQSSVSLKEYRNLVDPLTYHIEVRSASA